MKEKRIFSNSKYLISTTEEFIIEEQLFIGLHARILELSRN
jgi:hypothetical protein